MKTQDLLVSLNYYVMNAKKAAIYLSTQPDVDKMKIKHIESLLKTVQAQLETPDIVSKRVDTNTLDFSEAKERSVAP
jgi:phage host-nuclease inhibitor protein Gam